MQEIADPNPIISEIVDARDLADFHDTLVKVIGQRIACHPMNPLPVFGP